MEIREIIRRWQAGFSHEFRPVRSPLHAAVQVEQPLDVYGDEPVKAWNDLWGRILTELTIAHAAAAGATREDEVETATKTAVQGVSRGRMQRG